MPLVKHFKISVARSERLNDSITGVVFLDFTIISAPLAIMGCSMLFNFRKLPTIFR